MRPLSLSLLLALSSVALGGCPTTTSGNDAGTALPDARALQDAPPPQDAPSACSPEGTYDIVWTGDAANGPGCSIPMLTTTIGADGFDPGFGACPSSCATTCMRTPVSSASCVAMGTVTGPCASLAEGRTLTARYAFDGATATFTISDTGSPAGACSFTGRARRRP